MAQSASRKAFERWLAPRRRGVAITAVAAGALCLLLPALAGRLGPSTRVPSPFYTLTCDHSALPEAYVPPYMASVRRAVDRWNRAAPQPLFAWGDAAHAQILIRFVPALEEACGYISPSPPGTKQPTTIRIAVLEWGEFGYPVPHAPANIEQIAAHELGHALGLGHSSDLSNVMSSDQHWPFRLGERRLPERREWWPPARLPNRTAERDSRELPGPVVAADGLPNAGALPFFWKGDDLYGRGRRLPALDGYDQAVTACPGWSAPRIRRAQARLYLDPIAGLARLRKDRRALPHSAALAGLMLEYYSRLDADEGVRQGRKLLGEFGHEAMVLTSYGACLQRSGNEPEAEGIWSQALATAGSRTARAGIYRRMARRAQWGPEYRGNGASAPRAASPDAAQNGVRRALPFLEKAAALAGDDGGREQEELGIALWRLGRYREALPHLEVALRDYPGEPDTTLAAADCCFWLGRADAARQWLAGYRRLAPDPEYDALARHLAARLLPAPGLPVRVAIGLLAVFGLAMATIGGLLAARHGGAAAILRVIPPQPWPPVACRLLFAGTALVLLANLWLLFASHGLHPEFLGLLTGLLLGAGVAFLYGQHIARLQVRVRALEAEAAGPGAEALRRYQEATPEVAPAGAERRGDEVAAP